jgi:hypothetical protein
MLVMHIRGLLIRSITPQLSVIAMTDGTIDTIQQFTVQTTTHSRILQRHDRYTIEYLLGIPESTTPILAPPIAIGATVKAGALLWQNCIAEWIPRTEYYRYQWKYATVSTPVF